MGKFTPKGLSVRSFVFRISSRSSHAVGKVIEDNIPRPPALDTAAANSALDSQIIPPWIIGYWISNISVIRVLNIAPPFTPSLLGDAILVYV